ncbi:tryptophan synthase subunit alpha [Anaeromyxobacter diazotrophicus]|uniref:Tryptophan synthase alpha chain n=1 Tax=Anaeromyxobacter diazotrophicus TaxID=2590199 RepID=A0A7I9VSE2_9BACT|nr:tryptophan synthase subunit alpha [Anaeromyxobacter diazotrophicus]GEJ59372.1 tryptophan synthase alpha chain [Anaeromyxobacter diazotrophicus]
MSPATHPVAARDDRIASMFAAARDRGEAALVTYLMAGDPDLATAKAAAVACADGGTDLLEIGMPFSDPIADGPTLQRAAERALASGTTVASALEVAAHVRARSQVRLALMGYLNPVLSYGLERFFADAARSGVDAVILPDVPPEEAGELRRFADAAGVKTVFLLAPTSTEARRRAAAEVASGFLYFVSVTGVTGARRALPEDLAMRVAEVRAASPVPVVVGFGVSTPAQAHEVARLADGVVVGSALVARLAEPGSRAARAERVRRFVRSLKRAMLR